MDKYLTKEQIADLAVSNGYEPAALMAVIDVESSGHGFSSVTGKIIIQFEPSWFKRLNEDWPKHIVGHFWFKNKVENQTMEWIAFNDAYGIDPDAAMQATSIGMLQVMGFHYKELGFNTVGEMWNYGKESEFNQVDLGLRFIKSKPVLHNALKNKVWPAFAKFYNGEDYKKYNYDNRLAFSYGHYLSHMA